MRRAFTLVELAIGMGILAILLGVVTNIFVTTLQVQAQAREVAAVDADGRYILTRLGYDMGRATAITIPAVRGQTDTRLVLLINGGQYEYAVSADQKLLAGGEKVSSYLSQITGWQVQRVGNGTAKDTARVSFTVSAGGQSRQYQTTLGLR